MLTVQCFKILNKLFIIYPFLFFTFPPKINYNNIDITLCKLPQIHPI